MKKGVVRLSSPSVKSAKWPVRLLMLREKSPLLRVFYDKTDIKIKYVDLS